MSGGQFKRHDGFNKMQIKKGRIVMLRKDGRIKEDLGPYPKDPKDKRKK